MSEQRGRLRAARIAFEKRSGLLVGSFVTPWRGRSFLPLQAGAMRTSGRICGVSVGVFRWSVYLAVNPGRLS